MTCGIKRNASRNTAVDKYYTVIGLSGAQIAMNGTIGISRRGVLFFFYSHPLRLRAKAARGGRRDIGAARARNTFRRLLSRLVSCIMSYYKPR